MPQERPNHYGHLLEPGYKPGESIGSGYDYRGAATGRIHGDSQRRASPRFPTLEEAARRRSKRHRMLLLGFILCVAGGLSLYAAASFVH